MPGILSKTSSRDFFKGDKTIWVIYFLLCIVSLVEVFSASSRLTFANGASHWGPIVHQFVFLFFGLLIIIVFHRIPCKWFCVMPPICLPMSIILLASTALFGGNSLNGTNRWTQIAGISVQPSELVKCFLIMWTALILARTQTVIKNEKGKLIVGAVKGKPWKPFMYISVPLVICCGLIFMDNVSTAFMLFVVILAMMILGHIPWIYIFKGLGVLGIIAGFVMTIAFIMPEDALSNNSALKRLATVKHRIERFTGNDEKISPDDASYWFDDKHAQSTHAKIAVANSAGVGLGVGNSVQRDFLSHAESDFIYAIIVEETGLFGGIVVLLLYMTLFVRTGRIAQKCRKFFPAYLVLGFGMMIVLQALVNMAVAVGAIPVTGQNLPFISRGGSSIMMTSFYIAVILSVSRYADAAKRQEEANNKEETTMEEAPTAGETNEFATEGNMM